MLQLRSVIPRSRAVLLGAIPILATLALWTLLTAGQPEDRILSPVILPSPLEVIQSFGSLWWERALSRSASTSLGRVTIGFFVGAVLALPLGVAMAAFGAVRASFQPLVTVLGYLPIPTLVPLTLSFFGTGELQKVLFLALAFFIYLLPLAVQAVDGVDTIYLQTALTLGATPFEVITRVMVPIAAPELFQALRNGFGVGWGYIMLAEMVAADSGLGYLIITSQRRGPREHIYLVLVVITLLAFATDRLWAWAGRKLFPYRESR